MYWETAGLLFALCLFPKCREHQLWVFSGLFGVKEEKVGIDKMSVSAVIEDGLVASYVYWRDTREVLIWEQFNCWVRVTSSGPVTLNTILEVMGQNKS